MEDRKGSSEVIPIPIEFVMVFRRGTNDHIREDFVLSQDRALFRRLRTSKLQRLQASLRRHPRGDVLVSRSSNILAGFFLFADSERTSVCAGELIRVPVLEKGEWTETPARRACVVLRVLR